MRETERKIETVIEMDRLRWCRDRPEDRFEICVEKQKENWDYLFGSASEAKTNICSWSSHIKTTSHSLVTEVGLTLSRSKVLEALDSAGFNRTFNFAWWN